MTIAFLLIALVVMTTGRVCDVVEHLRGER